MKTYLRLLIIVLSIIGFNSQAYSAEKTIEDFTECMTASGPDDYFRLYGKGLLNKDEMRSLITDSHKLGHGYCFVLAREGKPYFFKYADGITKLKYVNSHWTFKYGKLTQVKLRK